MRRALPVLAPTAADRAAGTPPLGRREVIQWVGATLAVGAIPGCSSSSAPMMVTMPKPPPLAPFLTTKQQNALAALADYVIPPDKDPGGAALGVVSYVEQLLTALEGEGTPRIFAGGPYSGRQPYASPDGTPSSTFPPDSFKTFLPLDRYRMAAWKLRLYGSDGVPGGGVNDHVLGKTIGYREQMTQALEAAMAAVQGKLDASTPADQVKLAFDSMPSEAKAFINELVIEGSFSSPEYGGNRNLGGFSICHFEGDSQPLGYSLFDETTGTYKERPDAPVSTANPGPDPDPMDAATQSLISTLVTFAGGRVYP
jgi:hypothetical protein